MRVARLSSYNSPHPVPWELKSPTISRGSGICSTTCFNFWRLILTLGGMYIEAIDKDLPMILVWIATTSIPGVSGRFNLWKYKPCLIPIKTPPYESSLLFVTTLKLGILKSLSGPSQVSESAITSHLVLWIKTLRVSNLGTMLLQFYWRTENW